MSTIVHSCMNIKIKCKDIGRIWYMCRKRKLLRNRWGKRLAEQRRLHWFISYIDSSQKIIYIQLLSYQPVYCINIVTSTRDIRLGPRSVSVMPFRIVSFGLRAAFAQVILATVSLTKCHFEAGHLVPCILVPVFLVIVLLVNQAISEDCFYD